VILILNVVIDGQMLAIEVPQEAVNSASELFDKMDADMSKGWTIGKDFVANPDQLQRCQIVADKLLTAIDMENEKMKTMMAAYILARVPNVMTVHIDNNGELHETVLDLAPTE